MPLREEVRSEMEQSRFRLGPIRILPQFFLREAGYDSNIFGVSAEEKKIADWTATVSAGARWLVPVGPKLYLRGDAFPEYVWFGRLAKKRDFGGVFRTSLLGFFNRLSMDVGGSASKTTTVLSSENETRVIAGLREGSAKFEVDLWRRLSLFAGAEIQEIRYAKGASGPPELNVKEANHRSAGSRAGVRYRLAQRLDLLAGVEGSRTEFLSELREDQDNQAVAYLLGVNYGDAGASERAPTRFFVNLSAGYTVGEPHRGSFFPGYSTPTGSYFVSYLLARRLELQAYGHRGIIYSISGESPYFVETRNGGGLSIRIGRRLELRGWGQYGTNRYPLAVLLEQGSIKRRDKASAYGGGFAALLFRGVTWTAQAIQTDYTSNIPEKGRSIFRFTTGFSFEGVLSR